MRQTPLLHKSHAKMELDTTPNMEVGAREPGNDNKEKMAPTVPTIDSDPITPPMGQNIFHPTILYSYLVDGEGEKANDSVVAS